MSGPERTVIGVAWRHPSNAYPEYADPGASVDEDVLFLGLARLKTISISISMQSAAACSTAREDAASPELSLVWRSKAARRRRRGAPPDPAIISMADYIAAVKPLLTCSPVAGNSRVCETRCEAALVCRATAHPTRHTFHRAEEARCDAMRCDGGRAGLSRPRAVLVQKPAPHASR